MSQAYSQAKEYWTNERRPSALAAVLAIGIHVAIIALLLAGRASVPAQPAPLSVTLISATPQQSQQLEISYKPRIDQAVLHIPRPEIVLEDTAESSIAPISVVHASPRDAESEAPTHTPPAFDAAYLNNPVPSYPPLARRMREEGVVYVRVFVSPEGLPDQIELKRSSGSTRLDEAALHVVKKWRFVPARRGDQTVAAWVVVPIAFSLTA